MWDHCWCGGVEVTVDQDFFDKPVFSTDITRSDLYSLLPPWALPIVLGHTRLEEEGRKVTGCVISQEHRMYPWKTLNITLTMSGYMDQEEGSLIISKYISGNSNPRLWGTRLSDKEDVTFFLIKRRAAAGVGGVT